MDRTRTATGPIFFDGSFKTIEEKKEFRAASCFRAILAGWNLAKKKHKPKPGEKSPRKPGAKSKGKKE